MKRTLFALCLLAFLVAPHSLLATESARGYSYEAILQRYTVNEDSTVLVDEEQTFRFVGAYHSGWRSIVLKGVGEIDVIGVSDGATGAPLAYSSSRLDKLDPKSWGKYTAYTENGHKNIEWYYDLADTTHTFVLHYRLHGALGFFEDHDELYWNLATEYTVPIERLEATVILPRSVGTSSLSGFLYVDEGPAIAFPANDDRSISFARYDVSPYQKVTIAASWPKGVVSHRAYFVDLLRSQWGWLSFFVVIFASLIFAYYLQVIQPRRLGRGTIVPVYAPPEELPPAEAEFLVYERISTKTWPATIIDLAVRGYLRIEERSEFSWSKVAETLVPIAIFLPVLVFMLFIARLSYVSGAAFLFWAFFVAALVLSLPAILIVGGALRQYREGFGIKEFILTRTDKPRTDLRPYEGELIDALMGRGARFSTRDASKDREKQIEIASKMSELSDSFLTFLDADTGAFAAAPRTAKSVWMFFMLGILALLYLFQVFSNAYVWIFSHSAATAIAGFAIAASVAVVALHTTRLNQKGQLLKEDWLGFKLYLETAERYRMQNLTPDLFEKYLPYAMIFGIERKWAKAFEGIGMPSPSWYSGGSSMGGPYPNSGSSGFSSIAFASGFSASFASSFASSGGGGGGGGGGGRGGGGGGGGAG